MPADTDSRIVEDVMKQQRKFFTRGETRAVSFRKRELNKLLQSITEFEEEILQALKTDLNKSSFEAYATEVGIVRDEIRFFLKHTARFSKPRRAKTPLAHFRSHSRVYREPYGTVLVMAPWNYPFQLTMVPLIGALAAGNTAVVKPSRYAPATAKVIEKILNRSFPSEYVALLKGGREMNTLLLEQNFDYIFFTGSVNVGKVVMEAASRHLTPVSLELGGKSPCVVDEGAKIDLAAKRIIWGKLLNAGQTCVAPDYVLAHERVVDELLEAMKSYIKVFFGSNPASCPDYPKIISEKHFERLSELIKQSNLYSGGDLNRETLQIAPAIVYPADPEDEVMADEIFGPILPVLTYSRLEEALDFIRKRPNPLALYLFSESRQVEKRVLRELSFGGGCVNDTVVHLASPHVPFGGIGESGMGNYHGEASFNTFTHQKSVLKKTTLFDIALRYPPYKSSLKLLKKLLG